VTDAPQFRIDTSGSDHAPVLAVHGELDVSTASDLVHAARNALERGAAHLTIDLHDVIFIDSRGMSALVRTNVNAQAIGATFSIRNAVGNARRALDMSGLLDHLERS